MEEKVLKLKQRPSGLSQVFKKDFPINTWHFIRESLTGRD